MNSYSYNKDIVGLCETQWEGKGEFISDDYKVICRGGESGKNAVPVILNQKFENKVLNSYYVNDCLLMVKVSCKPGSLDIIQVYFPTSRYNNEMIDQIK